MKTKIFGKKMVNTYEIIDNLKEIEDENGEMRKVFTAKPSIKKHSEVDDWETIVPDIDGEIRYNSTALLWSLGRSQCINISKDETISIEEEVYRADLNEMHIFTDKVVSEHDYCKEEIEKRLGELIGDYNEQIIESDEKMTAYCKLHKLDTREADCEEVFKLVYPERTFKIKDGAIDAPAITVSTSSSSSSLDFYPYNHTLKFANGNLGVNTATICAYTTEE